jgi:GTP-binding protein
LLRQSGKPVIVVVNKVDNDRAQAAAGEFAQLGFDQMFPVSAIHGLGIIELLKTALARLPGSDEVDQPSGEPALKLAIVGRPNVGKSSLVNALTKSKRVVVTPIPGTTRDAVDVPFELQVDGTRERYLLIDTAGMRQARHVSDSIEFFSTKRAEESIRRCDMAVFLIDAETGIVEQDKKIGGKILEEKKPCIIALNKWDLFEKSVRAVQKKSSKEKNKSRGGRPMTSLAEFGEWVHRQLFFLDYAPVIFISAKEQSNLDRLLEAVRYVASQKKQKIPTSVLNRTLHDAIETRQPVSAKGDRLKFFYATQMSGTPPTFLLFVNRKHLLSDAYRKYLTNELRKAFGFEGCPIVLLARSREQREK